MRLQRRVFRCGSCGQEWHDDLLLECPIKIAVQVMKAIRCPQCRKRREVFLLFGEEAIAATKRLAESRAQEVPDAADDIA